MLSEILACTLRENTERERERGREFRLLCKVHKGLHPSLRGRVDHFLNCVTAATIAEQGPRTGVDFRVTIFEVIPEKFCYILFVNLLISMLALLTMIFSSLLDLIQKFSSAFLVRVLSIAMSSFCRVFTAHSFNFIG